MDNNLTCVLQSWEENVAWGIRKDLNQQNQIGKKFGVESVDQKKHPGFFCYFCIFLPIQGKILGQFNYS